MLIHARSRDWTDTRDVALTYAGNGAATVFEMQMGMVDRGADLMWVSQYPHERECCLPPLSGLQVLDTRVEESVLVVTVRISVNTLAQTLEQVVSKMQRSHLQLLKTISDDIMYAGAPKSTLIDLSHLEGQAALAEPADFNNADTYATWTKKALSSQAEAVRHLALRDTWEDDFRQLTAAEDATAAKSALAHRLLSCAELCSRIGDTHSATELLRMMLEITPWKAGVMKSESAAIVALQQRRRQLAQQIRVSRPVMASDPPIEIQSSVVELQIEHVEGSVSSRLVGEFIDRLRGGHSRKHAFKLAVKASLSVAHHQAAMQRAKGMVCRDGDPMENVAWRLEAADKLLSAGALQPWPATIIALAQNDEKLAAAIAHLAKVHLNVEDPLAPGACVLVRCNMGDCFHELEGFIESVTPEGYNCIVDQGSRKVTNAQSSDLLVVAESGVGELLRAAAERGAGEMVRALLAVGASVHLVNQRRNSALHAAVVHNHASVCRMLVEAGASPHGTNSATVSPHNLAVEMRHVACLHVFDPTPTDVDLTEEAIQASELLRAAAAGSLCQTTAVIDKGGGVNEALINGVTPLHVACRGNHVLTASSLLAANAKVDVQTTHLITPLLLASEEGWLEVVKLLCRGKANPSLADSECRTPLGVAAENGNVEVMKILLEAGANMSLANKRGHSPLIAAAAQGYLPAVALLIQWRADPCSMCADARATQRGADTALIAACRGDHVEVVDLLIQAKANVNQQEPLTAKSANLDGWTALLESSCKGKHILVSRLISAHADPNLNLKGNAGPLYFSACNGHLEATQILIAAHASVDNGDYSNGRNGLWWAAKEGHSAVIRLLLENGANPLHQLHERAERAGTSPVHMAAQHGHTRSVAILLEKGGSTEQEDKNGDRPLHFACREGHEEVVKLILESGSSSQLVDARNRAGQTPEDIVRAAGFERIVSLFQRHSRMSNHLTMPALQE